MCRTRHFRWKWQCATEIQLLNTPHDRRCCHGRQAMTPLSWFSTINTLCFPQENWHGNFRDRGWGRQRYLPPRLRGDMATPMAIALDSSLNFLLIRRVLVNTNGNGQHHVIIGINHCLWLGHETMVCAGAVCLTMFLWIGVAAPSWSPGAARQHTRELMSTTHTYPWLIP